MDVLELIDDVYIKSYDGYYHSDSFNLSLSDGYSWSEYYCRYRVWYQSSHPNSGTQPMVIISGTLNGTIRTNEQRALSEYISYYDDPNDDDDYSAYGGIKIRPVALLV